MASSIEWTDATWNPVTGCTKISAGCKFCYAEKMAKRLKAMGQEQYKDGFKLNLAPQMLDVPRKWRKGRMVFVNSMSDLFHEDIPLEYIQKVFKVMNETPQHTYQVLTKRAERLEKIAGELNWTKNIWMGVSVESDKVAHRAEHLRNTPARVKFLSIEPLIGSVDHSVVIGMDWVIVGGESGSNKVRPMKKEWVMPILIACQTWEIPFFFKQWGMKKHNPYPLDPTMDKNHEHYAKGGSQLNGFVYREIPEVL